MKLLGTMTKYRGKQIQLRLPREQLLCSEAHVETTQANDTKFEDQNHKFNKSEEGKVSRSEFCRKVLITICLIWVWICMGMFMEIAGPTLKDFKLRLNTTYEALSGAVSGRSVGKLVGSILGGFFVDKFGSLCYLVLCCALSAAAITTFCLPWVMSTTVLWFMYLLLGTSLGFINIAGQRIVLARWIEKAASPMHIVHLGYGVGGFMVPLIANPFLADIPDETSAAALNNSLNSSSFTLVNNTKNGNTPVSNIQYAYTIVGIITTVFAFIFCCFQIDAWKKAHGKPKENPESSEKLVTKKDDILLKKRTILQMINPAACADDNFCFGLVILLLMFLKYFFLVGVDRVLGTFLRSYAIDQLHFSKDDASYVNTVYWVTYAVGRFVCFIVAMFLSVKVLLIVETIGTVIIGIFMVAFALKYSISLWILTGCIGFILGPMFPTGIAWGDAHIEMTGVAITWIILGSAFGGFTYLKLGGFVYDKYGPPSVVYTYLGTVVIMAVFDFALACVGFFKKKIQICSSKKREVEKSDQERELKVGGFNI